MVEVKIPISLAEGAQAPQYQTEGSAGMDVFSFEDVRLEPMERKLVATGIRIAIPSGYEGQIRPRSGLAVKKGLSMVNTPGTIDSDYRGEVKVLLINFGSEAVEILKGDRIAQLVICPVARARWQELSELAATERGDGGFGSTGF